MKEPNNRLGIILMVSATLVFAIQDGFSRYLAENYNVLMIVMIRYWFFAAFVIYIASRSPLGLRNAIRTPQLNLQILRGLLLATEICVAVVAFVYLGLIESMAIFSIYPLLVAALSGPILGEHVGWRRWSAIAVGFVGILIILRPGIAAFSPYALIALCSAFLFALYSLLTRYVSRRDDTATSFFWTGVSGVVAMTLVGIWTWEPMTGFDSAMMAILCVLGVSGHWLLIKCLEVAEASAVQPFAYSHLVFVTFIGIFVFGEVLKVNVVVGAAIVIAAGVFTLIRSGQVVAEKA